MASQKKGYFLEKFGWGGRNRTFAWRNQNPLPYRLATPQRHLRPPGGEEQSGFAKSPQQCGRQATPRSRHCPGSRHVAEATCKAPRIGRLLRSMWD